MAQTLLCLITLLFVSALSDRSEHLERLSNYELVHIDVTNPKQSLTTIHFTAFGEEYVVELTRNDKLIPANVRHTNGIPANKAGRDDHFNSQTTSCHYHGKVVNSDKPSAAMISMCDKRGIRGYVHIDNDTLNIYPSAYYMDTSKNHHLLEDEHLIYKASDENVEKPEFKAVGYPDFRGVNFNEQRRRLQEANGGNNIVEVLLFMDPSLGDYYQDEYPDASNDEGTWYTEMTADMTDAVNWVSGIYEGTDWEDDDNRDLIGTISLTIVEFEYADAWSGKYTSLQPPFFYSNCLDYYDFQCAIAGDDWLDDVETWINKYKDTSTFDNFMIVTSKAMSDPNSGSGTAGWGGLSAVCQQGRSANNNRLNPAWSGNGLTALQETIAHELGHNFGARHDQQHPDGVCDENSGLMGYGNVGDSFSRCSKNDFNDYFASANLGCLAERTPALAQIDTGDGPGAINGRPTSAPTVTPDCLTLSNHPWGSTLNGDYQFNNQYLNDRKVYYSDDSTRYMYFTGTWWHIYTTAGSSSYNNYCPETTIINCDMNWRFGTTTVTIYDAARLYTCGGTPGDLQPASDSPTSSPTTSSPTTTAPTTDAPTTASPTTTAPTTDSPTTAAPTTASPTTSDPTTATPTTAAPTTTMPTTSDPTTTNPTTAAPTTDSPTTAAPTTSAPTTDSPTTASPTTASPTTDSPTTASPTTASPTTANPTTSAPTTDSPTTASPTTTAPTTAEPTAVTNNPTTAAPTTDSPTTDSPTTASPTTSAPTTDSPTTANPTTTSPTTSNPTTNAPTTSSPTTASPTTSSPTTSAPTTANPTTSAPTTSNPTTASPTTANPTTSNPTTASPTTAAPTTFDPTTAAPTTASPTTASPTTSEPTAVTGNPTTAAPTTYEPTTDAPTTNAPTTSFPTAAEEVGCGCDNSCYDCLTLTSLATTVDGLDLNGEYTPIGLCNDDRAAYQRSDGAFYLYYDDRYRFWFISTGLDDFNGIKALGRRCRRDVRTCSNKWYRLVDTNSFLFRRDRSSPIDDVCNGCDMCFSDDNVECLELSNYEEDVCVFNNNTVFDGYTNFQFMEACAYGKPVWYFSFEDNEDGMVDDNNFDLFDNDNGTDVTNTYYLHYDKYYKYQTDEYLSVRWIISEQEISIPGIAICEQEHLTNCTENSWIVGKSEGDYYERVVEHGMRFYNGHCDEAQGLVTEDDDKSLSAVNIIIIVLAAFAVIVTIAILFMCRSDKKRRDSQLSQMETLQKASHQANISPVNVDGFTGPEIEVEMETR